MSKEKVGILTLPLKNNYGGIIQLIALYHFLEKQGFRPVWIDKRQWQNPIKQSAIKLLEHNPFYKIYDPKEFGRSKEFMKIISSFLNNYLPERTSPIYNQMQLKKEISDFDTVVVGSDQVWRLEYVKDNYPTYFLDFVPEGKKKISYAASFGKDHWEGDKNSVEKIKNLLNDFDLITVREDTAVKVCKETFGIENAENVLDPSFLPEIDFYVEMIKNQDFHQKTGLFNYVLDPTEESDELVKKVAGQNQLDIHKIYLNASNFSKQDSLIAKWLAHFYYADFVVTDSFHGMVFSLIFNKQFLVICNKNRGATRFTSLLKQIDLEDRIFNSEGGFDKNFQKIDYEKINAKIKSLQIKSSELFLENL